MGDEPIVQEEKTQKDDLEIQIQNAKSYLMKNSTHSSYNVYDQLAGVLNKLLIDKPENVVDSFGELFRDSKRSRFEPNFDTIQDRQQESTEVVLAKTQQSLFESSPDEEDLLDPETEEEFEGPLSDIMERAFYFEQAGLGVSREETLRIFLAIKQLSDTYILQKCRFWGKIVGLKANYIVAEVEFREGEDPEEHKVSEENLVDDAPTEDQEDQEGDLDQHGDELPTSQFKPPPLIPLEQLRTGCNKYVYFVTNEPGTSWSRLPEVTPSQITIARQIKKFFTGDLDAAVISYPPFPGKEAEYLRAQISRISSSTHISPLNYFMFDEEEEEEDENAIRDTFVENLEFEPVSTNDMVDPSLANWVHHVQYILPQGRCTWWNPKQKSEEEEEEEEEDEEEREEPDEPEPESGPPLLTPLSEDAEVDGMPPWTAYKSTALVPTYAIAVMKSNLWPGACAFSSGRMFENLYIGTGLKYSADNYSPPPPPIPLDEFPSGPDITETDDPSVEEEKALQAAQQEAMEGNEEEEEEEEEEDEDDD